MSRVILTFHDLSDAGGVLHFPVRQFEQLIETLLERQVPLLTFEDLQRAERGVTLTFDDGMRSVHDHALPILRANDVPAHCFVASGEIGSGRWRHAPGGARGGEVMTWEQVEACHAGGISIESHTEFHPDLRALGDAEVRSQCERCDAQITAHTGRRPRYFAYPYGAADARVAALIHGRYDAVFTTRMDFLPSSFDPSGVPRIDAFYLRGLPSRTDPTTWGSRAYLGVRRLLRNLRGQA